jgi:hypothetical protein
MPLKRYWPTVLAVSAAAAYAAWRLATAGWDPVGAFEVGTRYTQGDPEGTPGYDGQFTLFIALDPAPQRVAPTLDVPAYRYQRILLPLLARAAGLGDPQAIPWALIALNLVAHAIGAWSVNRIVLDRGLWPGYAVTYGLWVGILAGVGLALTEPLAYALIAAGWLLRERGRTLSGTALLGLSLFAKETTLTLWLAALAADLAQRRRGRALWAAWAIPGLAFAVGQLWLLRTFGQLGLGSGGEMATPMELVPFMGLWRIGSVSWRVLGVYLVLFGPSIVLPSVWAASRGLRDLLARSWRDETWSLALNGLFIFVLPFSTFREPFGLVRVASGLVLAVLLYASRVGARRALNYSMFWIALLTMLISR